MSAAAFILTMLAVAAVTHVLVILRFPYMVMRIVRRVAKYPVNELFHMPPTTSESRSVVRPSPDLLYSACLYDVSERPLRIHATLPGSYWSISFFANNTDNFFVMNDAQIGAGEAEFLLVGRGRAKPAGPGTVVEAQSYRGVILIRMLVEKPEAIGDLIAVQKLAYGELLPG
ncbi:MAG: DUF1254 domain-containing protein [Bauldia sp.]|nr:DUF1254 domain-containing protein [Bauldia sp.]